MKNKDGRDGGGGRGREREGEREREREREGERGQQGPMALRAASGSEASALDDGCNTFTVQEAMDDIGDSWWRE
jgi:hypothetical protein